MKRVISIALAAVLFTSCAQLATVRNAEPRAPSTASVSARTFPTEREARPDPEAGLSQNLEIATTAWADLSRDPSNGCAVQVYNYSVGRMVSLLQSTGKLPQSGAVTIGTGVRAFASDVKDFADPQTCHFIAADELAISGKDYTERVRREGIGIPVLAERDSPLKSTRKQFLTNAPTRGGQFFDAFRSPSRRRGVHRRFDLSTIESWPEIPACRGPKGGPGWRPRM